MSNWCQMDRVTLSAAVERVRRAGIYHHVPLLEAVRDGRIALVWLSGRDTPLSMRKLKCAPRPVIVLIGDDDDFPTGPAAWISAPKAIRWARRVVLHGAGGESWHYQAAVDTAEVVGRVLIIETNSTHLPAWGAALGNKPRLTVVPRNGMHPLPEKEARH